MCKYKRQSMFIEFCQKSQKEVFFGKLIKTSQKDTEKKIEKRKKKEEKKMLKRKWKWTKRKLVSMVFN